MAKRTWKTFYRRLSGGRKDSEISYGHVHSKEVAHFSDDTQFDGLYYWWK